MVLTGFMGTGKTTVGRLLASRLGFDFVDTDAVIEERHGPIPEIFLTQGEDAFRAYEREVATELGGRTALVIATGGRLMLDPTAAAALTAGGRVFCLAAELATVLARVTADGVDSRPMLAGADVEERVAELYASRAEAYAAFEQVPTDGRTPDEVADDLVARLAA